MSEDANLDALIVRNIGEIEAALQRATTELDKRFFEEVEQAAQNSSSQAWNVKSDEDPDENTVWLTKSDWRVGGDKDFRLVFDGLPGANDELDWTWIAMATGSGPTGATFALLFKHESITAARFKRLLNNKPDLITRLRNHGFERDESEKQLFFPITIDREALAHAFEEDDFDAALEPVGAAVKAANAAMENLDELVRLIRETSNL